MTDSLPEDRSDAEPPVRDGGPVEEVRGNREAPPTATEPAPPEQAPPHDDAYLRLAADFDNYKKRVARDQAEMVRRATERLVKELLPVLDDLERALEAANEHEEAKLEDGVRLVHRALADVLRKEGVEEIAAEGAFDPHVHEALLTQPGDGVQSGAVLQVLQKGYRLGDKVVRPARVIVAE